VASTKRLRDRQAQTQAAESPGDDALSCWKALKMIAGLSIDADALVGNSTARRRCVDVARANRDAVARGVNLSALLRGSRKPRQPRIATHVMTARPSDSQIAHRLSSTSRSCFE
jgi:hypothetical protein